MEQVSGHETLPMELVGLSQIKLLETKEQDITTNFFGQFEHHK